MKIIEFQWKSMNFLQNQWISLKIIEFLRKSMIFSAGAGSAAGRARAGKSLKIIENRWKSLKIIENHYKSLKINENHWKSLKNHWKSLKIIENHRKSLKIIETHWKSMKNNENQWWDPVSDFQKIQAWFSNTGFIVNS